MVRMLAFITLGSGALIDTAIGACEGKGSGEQSLMIKMIPNLNTGDIVLGDAIFETYFILALLLIAHWIGASAATWGMHRHPLGKDDA